MKIKVLTCRLDGTQALRETEVPDDWAAPAQPVTDAKNPPAADTES